MNKYRVLVSARIDCFGTIEIEAEDQRHAEIVAKESAGGALLAPDFSTIGDHFVQKVELIDGLVKLYLSCPHCWHKWEKEMATKAIEIPLCPKCREGDVEIFNKEECA